MDELEPSDVLVCRHCTDKERKRQQKKRPVVVVDSSEDEKVAETSTSVKKLVRVVKKKNVLPAWKQVIDLTNSSADDNEV
jgi:hypothetical protein